MPGRPTATGPAGRYDPARGLRCNPAKLLLDPYARAHQRRRSAFGPEVLGYAADDPDAPSTLDSAGHVPRSLVVDPSRSAGRDGARPRRPYADTVIYEVHVKGFTMRHPDVPAELRGTYAGLGHEAAIAHLLDLGVTAVELLPVHQSVPEAFLAAAGPDQLLGLQHDRLSSRRTTATPPRCGPAGPAARSPSSRRWSTRCTRPGSRCCSTWCSTTPPRATSSGPTLCYRGLDNPAYYRLDPGDPRRYVDTTGCGNSLNVGDPRHPAADHGLAAVLADRDARRRLPVRPGAHAGPPGGRVRAACRRSSTWSPRIRWCRAPS